MSKYVGLLISGLVMLALAALPHAAQAETSEGHKIKSVKESGQLIELYDGSSWQIINPADQEIAYGWLPYQSVSVLNGKELRNDHTGQRIDAKMIQEPVRPKASAPSSTPTYPAAAAGRSGAGGMATAAAQPPVERKMLEQIMKRLDTLDAKLQVMDWRLRKLEKDVISKP
ncbi:hypothetical protein AAU61_03385 [Desulfocarbo indianensis]|nr:hypothetical protein AAU61_03385 [Desulfocarbo indianensis]